MFLFSISIYVIGLSGAFLQSNKTFIPASIAVLALLSAEIAWRVVLKARPDAAAAKWTK
jgi:hypothetical protein